jgi:hypothetical protein
MKLWLRDMFVWINPVNWLGETWRLESRRRIEALENHLSSLEERYSALENLVNYHLAAGAHLPLVSPPPEGDEW